MPKLSIIIPVYRVEAYLDACVQSVLSQPRADEAELWLVDDGSPDSCGLICDAWAARCPNIHVLHKENGGLSDARNAGIRAAQGGYLMFLDSDDTLLPDAVPRTLALCEAHAPQVVVGHYATVCEENGKVLLECDTVLPSAQINGQPGDSVVTAMKYARVSPCAWRYTVERKWLLEQQLFFEKGRLSEDALWTPRLLCTAERFWHNPQPFYRYLVRANSIMTTPSFRRLTDLLWICEQQEAFAQGLSPAKQAYIYHFLCLLLNNLLQSYGALETPQKKEIDQWFSAHKKLVWAAARQQPAVCAAARVLGVQRAMRLGAAAVSVKLRLQKG